MISSQPSPLTGESLPCCFPARGSSLTSIFCDTFLLNTLQDQKTLSMRMQKHHVLDELESQKSLSKDIVVVLLLVPQPVAYMYSTTALYTPQWAVDVYSMQKQSPPQLFYSCPELFFYYRSHPHCRSDCQDIIEVILIRLQCLEI